jgi:hypothetical protein
MVKYVESTGLSSISDEELEKAIVRMRTDPWRYITEDMIINELVKRAELEKKKEFDALVLLKDREFGALIQRIQFLGT